MNVSKYDSFSQALVNSEHKGRIPKLMRLARHSSQGMKCVGRRITNNIIITEPNSFSATYLTYN